jgi:hypothetical protein
VSDPRHHPLRPPEGDDEGPRHPAGKTAILVIGITLLIVLLAVISTLQQT